jgi:uncharacterized protein (DUF58 family)
MAAEARIIPEKDRGLKQGQQNNALSLARTMPRLSAEARRIAASVAAGIHGRRRAGQGDSFWQFRPFTSGEATQRIDWRRSARDDRIYIRDREWEAAETVWLMLDRSPSMAFQSSLSPVSKLDRCLVLGLALADMLVRGGERVGLHGLCAPTASRRVIERLAESIILHADKSETLTTSALGARDEAVILGDFIGDAALFSRQWQALASKGARGHVIMIADPIEEIFPYEGETEFLDPETGDRLRVGDANSFKQRYHDRLAAHREELRRMATALGWSFTLHRTDKPASDVLLAMIGIIGQGLSSAPMREAV